MGIPQERLTSVTYQGVATQTRYTFHFDYLNKKFVKVLLTDSLYGIEQELTQNIDYTVYQKEITLNTPTNKIIKIYRKTDTLPTVSWEEGSVLRATDLTLQDTQVYHLIEESVEGNKTNSEMLNDAIHLVNDAMTAASIATNKATEATNSASQAVINVTIATNAANDTINQAVAGAVSATTAIANNAKLSEDNAKESELNAKNSENNAQTYATKLESADINLRKNSKTYVVGDVAYSLNLPTWARLDCIQGGATVSTEPTWGTVTAGQMFTDGTVQWRIADVKSSGDSVGSIKAWLVKNIPAGWLDVSTGAIVSRGTYPELWAWVQANAPLISEADWQTQASMQSSVGAFSTGDGSTTFRLPRIVDYIRGGILADVGNWQGDAIRNITGTMGAYSDYNTPFSGAISRDTSARNLTLPGGSIVGTQTFSFNASRVVPTADENRPKTIKFVYCIKAFGSPTNQGLIDITALANEMAGKQQTISYIQIQDKKPSGTAGGTFASGAWRTRDLNTIIKDDTGQVVLSNNRFTLPVGKYEITAIAPAARVNNNRARLYNVTDGTSVYSDNQYANADVNFHSLTTVMTVLTITTPTVFEIQHYASGTFNTEGFGIATSIPGVNEVYTQIIIRKVG